MDSQKVCIVRYSKGGSCTISGVECAECFGVQGIKGKTLTTPGHWADGTTTFIPLDRIDSIMEFNSVEEATAAMQRWMAKSQGTSQPQKRRGWFGSK
jgi:hypothetical protein